MNTYLNINQEELKQKDCYWTAKEITQQPDCWKKTFEIIDNNRHQIQSFLAPILQKKDLKIILTGAGTSEFVGHTLKPTLAQYMDCDIDSIPTTSILSNPYQYLKKERPTLLISYARSGDSPESLSSVNLLDQIVDDSYHLIITCNANGSLYRNSNKESNKLAILMPEETNDVGFAMTSSFSCMLLATAIIFLPKFFNKNAIEYLADEANYLINEYSHHLQTISKDKISRLVYLGSGSLQGIAQESALKTLELNAGSIATFYDSSLGFRHGPKSIINKETRIIMFISNNKYTKQYDLDLYNELQKDKQALDVVSVVPSSTVEGLIKLNAKDDVLDLMLALPYVLVGQIYGFYTSYYAGLTADNPCPTGEVNRVVKGVIIHQYN